MKLLLIFFILLCLDILNGTSAFAKTSYLQKTLNKYSQAKSVQVDIKKTDEKIVLGTKSESSGILKYEKNKIYISQNGDKKVEFFYNDSTLTLVEYTDADFGK
ncbi:MAG: hypothetical protein ACXVAX_12830, partial [Pseudobdellovibrio sp.]